MIAGIRAVGAIALSAALLSCGGGGGGGGDAGGGSPGSGGGGDAAPLANSIQTYVGQYVAGCEFLGTDVNLDQGGEVYGRITSNVVRVSDRTASFSYRVDFYADDQCAVVPLGSLANDNPRNTVTIVGAAMVGGVVADQVRFSIGQSDTPFASGGSPDIAIIGSAVRLALPATLVQGFDLDDLWRLEGEVLYEGDLTLGVDGFPTGLDRTLSVRRVVEVPPAAPAACAASTVSWTGVGGQCLASLPLSIAGNVMGVEDRDGVVIGNASFECSNGTWRERPHSVCWDTQPPPVAKCPAQTWTWTVNGEVCSGQSKAVVQDGFDHVSSETPGRYGVKGVFCRMNEGGVLAWSELHANGIKYESCALPPVPPPPAVEPMEILQRANCLMCHAVSGNTSFLTFETIAAHYRGNPPAPGVLEDKIRFGGAGVFGTTPMPSNPQISDTQIDIIVPWILSR